MAEAAPALEIRNLHKRYGELEVLKGISLTARDGDVISILGSSGSGKSTFLRGLSHVRSSLCSVHSCCWAAFLARRQASIAS